MEKLFHIGLLLLYVATSVSVRNLPTPTNKNGNNVCQYKWYTRQRTLVQCTGSWYYWEKCPVYSTVEQTGLYCCNDHINSIDDPSECNLALCNGKTNNDGACDQSYTDDKIQYRTGVIQRHSGGQCNSPGVCSNCNDGFYPDGTSCKICPQIENCFHRSCTGADDVTCKYCIGEYKDKVYWRKYSHDKDGGKSCQKMCSWSADSIRCYPGACKNETDDSCVCASGYTGSQCDQLTEDPSILFNEVKLLTMRGEIITNPADPSKAYTPPEVEVWTNAVEILNLTAEFRAKYQTSTGAIPAPDPAGENHYVTDFKTGIIGGEMSFTLIRDGLPMHPVLREICVGGSEGSPVPLNYKCQVTEANPIRVFDAWGMLHSNDTIVFSISTTNGGFVEFMDRDNDNRKTKYSLTGRSVSRNYTYRIDAEPPYLSCIEKLGTGCSTPLTVAPDITDNSSVTFTWDTWTDELTGVDKFQYQVFQLGHDGSLLSEAKGKAVTSQEDILTTDTEKTITLPEPGVFSIIFTAFDKTGNHKSARTLIFFDNNSSVDLVTDKVIQTPLATATTNNVWITEDTREIPFYWTDRFINSRHVNNRWLNAVDSYVDVCDALDDKYGNRSTKSISNNDGIMNFEIAYEVRTTGNAVKDSQEYTVTPDFPKEEGTVNVTWDDGDELKVKVKAVDIFDSYNEDGFTVYREVSPPVIERFWLRQGNETNQFVHSTASFTDLTIEWDVYDVHSGLESVSWRLFDNYTGAVVLHGQEDLAPQKENTLGDCTTTYDSDPSACYCTPFWGCFHKHFTVKPEIKTDAGLIAGKETGIHDHDYYIEVNAMNPAKLSIMATIKITIDLSAPSSGASHDGVEGPHSGSVHDGVRGSPEVDFQQSRTLHAYWDGFFDRESGVSLYLYTYDTQCRSGANMTIDNDDPDLIQTISTSVTHNVTSDGTYFITVVAVNKALLSSESVCSDGVTVETTTVEISEVYVEGAFVKEGLVKDSGNTKIWILGKDRFRRLLNNPPVDCFAKATSLSDLEMYPQMRDVSENVTQVNGTVFCANTSAAATDIKAVIMRSTTMFVEWLPVSLSEKVYDYEFGISSTTAGSAAPDIKEFYSTKHHPYTNIRHAHIATGTEFHLVIKTITKAEVETVQTIGPFIMDATPPIFTGEIDISVSGDYLVSSWPANAFQDTEDIYGLTYSFAIGEGPYGTDLQQYEPLTGGATCTLVSPPTCTAAKISDFSWQLHGNKKYYISVRAENSIGLHTQVTSKPYQYDIGGPTKGVVWDISAENDISHIPFKDIEDIDYQISKTSLAARWSGFSHTYLDVSYKVSIGTSAGTADVMGITDVGSKTAYKKTGLTLVHLQTYYFTVQAVTTTGSVTLTSDGVTVVTNSATLTGINVFDGKPCNTSVDDGALFNHHSEENRITCEEDVTYQASLNSIMAYWTLPTNMIPFTRDAFWSVEERSAGASWTSKAPFEYIGTAWNAERHDLALASGKTYRATLRLCVGDICFKEISSNGVTVLANPPVTGSLSVTHWNSSNGDGNDKLEVTLDRFYDPDIEDRTQRYDVIDKYEWSIADSSVYGNLYRNWTKLESFTVENVTTMKFDFEIEGAMDFSKCKSFTIRGYNKVRLWSAVTTEIKLCESFDPKLIIPSTVLDAFGTIDYNFDGTPKTGYGKSIFLAQNYAWDELDVDYTPYHNIISAVWPSLRHRNYQYAVLKTNGLDLTTYYLPSNQLRLTNPCDHPNAIGCGETTSEFMNMNFPDGVLQHGHRYIVCMHANSTDVARETWVENLPETSVCSDGVVVDLTPPESGKVWIGSDSDTEYQASTTDMYVNWESFRDVEEFGSTPHAWGIKSYTLAVGSFPGGFDVVAPTDVGLINHIAFHGLHLMNGNTYYATLNATDFVNHVTTKESSGVLVDITPPVKTAKSITITGRHISSLTHVSACWNGLFMDAESGIQHYLWAVGSNPGIDDIMPFVSTSDESCGTSDKNAPLNLIEGHAYFISVRAYNKAGLYNQASSWAYVVDLSAPVAGSLYDGKRNKSLQGIQDKDYQQEATYLTAHWQGFIDPHSSITEYYIHIGTCPMCADVLPEQPIGIANEFTLSRHLAEGKPYYTTVKACNTADMCSSATSDGIVIDSSKPIAGVVQDGVLSSDIRYQGVRNHIGAKWFGFVDSESGIDYYEWRAGTEDAGDNVIKSTELHNQQMVLDYNITDLPINTMIYITVRAYNKAGLYVESRSNGFIVDITPPAISYIRLSRDFGSIVEDTVVLRTSLKVEWSAEDKESYIRRQYVSIKSHRGGDFRLSPTKINGIKRNHIFTGLDLHDGMKYYATLICCNGAGLCSESESQAILTDTSPPTRGAFAIQTNNAADVNRTVENFMTWQSRRVLLSWLGFSDIHSGVDYYNITVGSTVMSNDLVQGNDKFVKVFHNSTAEIYDEGRIQTVVIKTENLHEHVTNGIYISIVAVNTVGMYSAIVNSKFTLNLDGTLGLVRRCQPYTCLGHCGCAQQDQMCSTLGYDPCENTTQESNIEVRDVLDYRFSDSPLDVSYTPSKAELGALWRISRFEESGPMWYEWSVGIAESEEPEGIFDGTSDRVWHEVGQRMEKVYVIDRGKELTESTSYSFFIRAWWTFTNYTIYKTDGVEVFIRELSTTKSKGIAVTESTTSSKKRDLDEMIRGPFYVDWTNKFINAESLIDHFNVYLSTYPGGNDVYTVDEELSSTSTRYHFNKRIGHYLDFRTKYYSNVIAVTHIGTQITESSDGFSIDEGVPISGLVQDGLDTIDVDFQANDTTVSATWRGFADYGSGIRHYKWCVGNTTSDDECSVRGRENVGLKTRVERTLGHNINQGSVIYNKVRAIDALGSSSVTTVSDGVTIDSSPPVPGVLSHENETNNIKNPSFEVSSGDAMTLDEFNGTDTCTVGTSVTLTDWTLSESTCVAVIKSSTITASDGSYFVLVRGSIHQIVADLIPGNVYQITLETSHNPSETASIANKEAYVDISGEKHVFLLYTKPLTHGSSYGNEISWHRQTFYHTVKADSLNLTIGSSNEGTGLLVDNVSLQKVTVSSGESSNGTVEAHVTVLQEWGSIHSSWMFVDQESPIIDYTWAIGYVNGGTLVQDFKSVGLRTFGYKSDITLIHKSYIHITVIATNSHGLRGVAYSEPILVDLTAPNITMVNDGMQEDIDISDQNAIHVKWTVDDPESEISYCEWAIGFNPDGKELQNFTRITSNSYTASVLDIAYSTVEDKLIYSTVKCYNSHGLHSAKSSDGFRISQKKPNSTSADLQVIPISCTEYQADSNYQNFKSKVLLKWTGFTDTQSVEGYEFSLSAPDTSKITYRILTSGQSVHFAVLNNLILSDGEHQASVFAFNPQYLESEQAIYSFNVSTSVPYFNVSHTLESVWTASKRTLLVSWEGLFTSTDLKYYEVSAGSYYGGGDIVQWIETRGSTVQFSIPSAIKNLSGLKIYMIVRAVTFSGMRAIKTETITLP